MPSKKRATPISLQPLDALFGTNEETNNGICEIEIGSLHPFPNHPFQVKMIRRMKKQKTQRLELKSPAMKRIIFIHL